LRNMEARFIGMRKKGVFDQPVCNNTGQQSVRKQ
jgi:hypothetical protein